MGGVEKGNGKGKKKKLLRYRETISLVVRTRGKSLSFAKSGPYRSWQNSPVGEYQNDLVRRFLGKDCQSNNVVVQGNSGGSHFRSDANVMSFSVGVFLGDDAKMATC